MTIMEMTRISYSINSQTGGRKFFDWSGMIQAVILASFYIGYMISHIPGEYLPYHFGARAILGVGIFIASATTTLIPVCLYANKCRLPNSFFLNLC